VTVLTFLVNIEYTLLNATVVRCSDAK